MDLLKTTYWLRLGNSKIYCKTDKKIYEIVDFSDDAIQYRRLGDDGRWERATIPCTFIENFDLKEYRGLNELLFD